MYKDAGEYLVSYRFKTAPLGGPNNDCKFSSEEVYVVATSVDAATLAAKERLVDVFSEKFPNNRTDITILAVELRHGIFAVSKAVFDEAEFRGNYSVSAI
jgi:hypothetical protein